MLNFLITLFFLYFTISSSSLMMMINLFIISLLMSMKLYMLNIYIWYIIIFLMVFVTGLLMIFAFFSSYVNEEPLMQKFNYFLYVIPFAFLVWLITSGSDYKSFLYVGTNNACMNMYDFMLIAFVFMSLLLLVIFYMRLTHMKGKSIRKMF